MCMLLFAFLEYIQYRPKADKWGKTAGRNPLNDFIILWLQQHSIFTTPYNYSCEYPGLQTAFIMETATWQTASFTDPNTSRLSPW